MTERPRYLNAWGWRITRLSTLEVVERDQPIGVISNSHGGIKLKADLNNRQHVLEAEDGRILRRPLPSQNRMAPEYQETIHADTSVLDVGTWSTGLNRDAYGFVKAAGGTLEKRDKTKLFPQSLALKP